MTFSTKVLCSLAMLLVPYQVDARKLEFRMADFGIRPNQPTDSLLTSKLHKALEEIRQKVAEGDRVVLKFENGRYDFHASDAPAYATIHFQPRPKPTETGGLHAGRMEQPRGGGKRC